MRVSSSTFRVWNKETQKMESFKTAQIGDTIMLNSGILCSHIDIEDGKEFIYEDDILSYNYPHEITREIVKYYGVVAFTEGHFYLDFIQYGPPIYISNDNYNFQIVGNIYDKTTWKNIKNKEFVKLLENW